LVICTQVLERVADLSAVLRELYRVLKPGGSLWLTAPFFFAEHMQPHDYYMA
jgi:ubiquinone/menaquinone biosynthesis C-methylase UbiE